MSEQFQYFLICECMIAVSSLANVAAIKYFGLIGQAHVMFNMSLIIRAVHIDPDFYHPKEGNAYRHKDGTLRSGESLDVKNRCAKKFKFLLSGARNVPLGKHVSFVASATYLLVFLIWLCVDDFGTVDNLQEDAFVQVIGFFWMPGIFCLIYNYCMMFIDEKRVDVLNWYGWAIIALLLGIVLWTDTISFGDLDCMFECFVSVFFIQPLIMKSIIIKDEIIEQGTTGRIQDDDEEEEDDDDVNVAIGALQTSRLRCLALLAVFVLLVAAVAGLLGQGKMCFHPEDELTLEQKELCEKGRVIMTSADVHTKALHNVLQGLASSRGKAYPNGSTVTIPTSKNENIKTMVCFVKY